MGQIIITVKYYIRKWIEMGDKFGGFAIKLSVSYST